MHGFYYTLIMNSFSFITHYLAIKVHEPNTRHGILPKMSASQMRIIKNVRTIHDLTQFEIKQ